ncbi:hypothetical protein VZG28_05250 [Synechococcus elongatus IITB4]|uniref:hypothetical protein n=1 Tax=Synechococcus elongatus TaxID=32046 RepID=UPI0030D3320A
MTALEIGDRLRLEFPVGPLPADTAIGFRCGSDFFHFQPQIDPRLWQNALLVYSIVTVLRAEQYFALESDLPEFLRVLQWERSQDGSAWLCVSQTDNSDPLLDHVRVALARDMRCYLVNMETVRHFQPWLGNHMLQLPQPVGVGISLAGIIDESSSMAEAWREVLREDSPPRPRTPEPVDHEQLRRLKESSRNGILQLIEGDPPIAAIDTLWDAIRADFSGSFLSLVDNPLWERLKLEVGRLQSAITSIEAKAEANLGVIDKDAFKEAAIPPVVSEK